MCRVHVELCMYAGAAFEIAGKEQCESPIVTLEICYRLEVYTYPGGSAREMRAAVTVFHGIARNCVITLRFLPVSARGANTRSCGISRYTARC